MAELIDVLDENGVKTGRVVSRYEVHKEGLWHRIAAIAIIDGQDRILLQQRANGKMTNPGKWDIAAAGHIDAGEDALTTIIREVNEEVGIKIDEGYSVKDFRYMTSYRKESFFEWDGEEMVDRQFFDWFVLRKQEIDVASLKLQESEVQAVKLCSLEEFWRMMDEGVLVNRKPLYDELIKMMDTENNVLIAPAVFAFSSAAG